MFRRQSDGTEIYFTWPRGTARIVPDRAVHAAIFLRDSAAGFLFVFSWLLIALKAGEGSGLAMIALIGCMIERRFYLSKLKKVPLEVSPAQFDQAYLRERTIFDGMVFFGFGSFGAILLGFVAFEQYSKGELTLLLGFLELPVFLGVLTMLYVGFRILVATSRRRRR